MTAFWQLILLWDAQDDGNLIALLAARSLGWCMGACSESTFVARLVLLPLANSHSSICFSPFGSCRIRVARGRIYAHGLDPFSTRVEVTGTGRFGSSGCKPSVCLGVPVPFGGKTLKGCFGGSPKGTSYIAFRCPECACFRALNHRCRSDRCCIRLLWLFQLHPQKPNQVLQALCRRSVVSLAFCSHHSSLWRPGSLDVPRLGL